MEAARPRAVFLSYASQDAEAARRIADALRAFGVEVWFDQSELRGGDAWDQKIRKQIHECALFLPIISATTQERSEGYFRREWKLAVERTHDMAEGVPFIVPVVVDDISEASALVPEPFLRVQWTRLPHGVPSPQFVEQVKRLLALPHQPVTGGARRTEGGGQKSEDRGQTSTGRKTGAWTWGALAVMVLVGIAVAFWVTRKPASTAPQLGDKSIAVLPFANMSPDPENAFFADGVHEDVITNLAKIRDLKVISRTSVLAYRDPAARNLRKIASELGVATVLEGSVRRDDRNKKVRVTAQLIDARTDQHLWAETYDRNLTDVFALQSTLAQEIAAALKANLTPNERALIDRVPTQSKEAYDLYLRARAMQQTLSQQDAREQYEPVAVAYERAIEKDPTFVLAYVQLSLVHGGLYWLGHRDPTPARLERARAAVETARRLAPDLPETRLALGAFHYFALEWNRALAEFRLAEAGLPNDAQLHYWIGLAHRRLGQWQDAIDEGERALALNPGSLNYVNPHLQTLMFVRRFARAHEIAMRYAARFPDNRSITVFMASSRYAMSGDRAAYLRQMAVLPPRPDDPLGLLDPYDAAMRRGDYAAAGQALADPRTKNVLGTADVIKDPVTLHQAMVAFLSNQRDAARAFADQAVADYHRGQWPPRQEPWMLMGVARAGAYAGRTQEAVQGARHALAITVARDAFDTAGLRPQLGHVYLTLDRREEALTCLREMMTGPCPLSPQDVRDDPFWSRLKDEPRFEEILKSAKPF